MSYTKIPLIISLIFLNSTSFSQVNSQQAVDLVNGFNQYLINGMDESVYIQTDRQQYLPSDTIWYKTYLNNELEPWIEAKSKIIYVQLISPLGDIISTQQIYPLLKGGEGYIVIPNEADKYYLLRGYTSVQKNEAHIFQKKISITSPGPIQIINNPSTPVIRYYPEGGYLVNNLRNTIGLQVRSELGNIKDSVLLIADEKKVVAKTLLDENGLGKIDFIPVPNVSYELQLAKDSSVRNPINDIKKEGSIVTTAYQNGLYTVSVSSNPSTLAGHVLFGHIKGKIVLVADCPDRQAFQFQLNPSDLPSGVLHLTLFNQQLKPINERLIFIENPKEQYYQSLIIDKDTYGKRDELNATIDLSAFEDIANVSISVNKSSIFQPADQNIKSWFWLSTDLPEDIYNPAQYFSENDIDIVGLDKVLLTHGWRKFKWNELLSEQIMVDNSYDKGFALNGTVKYKDSNKGVYGSVKLTTSGQSISQFETKTDENGNFTFDSLVLYESDAFFLETKEYRKKSKKPLKVKTPTTAILETFKVPNPTVQLPNPTLVVDSTQLINSKNELEQLRKRIEEIKAMYDSDVVILDDFTITADRETQVTEALKTADAMYGNPSSRLFTDSLTNIEAARNAFDLIKGRVAGVQVNGNSILIRGVNSLSTPGTATVVIDGIVTDGSQLDAIPASDIMMIDVLRGADAASYGARGGNGVVVIYTRRGANVKDRTLDWGMDYFTGVGYHSARTFYSPNHGGKFKDPRPDIRKTEFWAPVVITNEMGQAELSFFTSDAKGLYVIILEGLSIKGIPIYDKLTYEVK